jgi:hypothetical protein
MESFLILQAGTLGGRDECTKFSYAFLVEGADGNRRRLSPLLVLETDILGQPHTEHLDGMMLPLQDVDNTGIMTIESKEVERHSGLNGVHASPAAKC